MAIATRAENRTVPEIQKDLAATRQAIGAAEADVVRYSQQRDTAASVDALDKAETAVRRTTVTVRAATNRLAELETELRDTEDAIRSAALAQAQTEFRPVRAKVIDKFNELAALVEQEEVLHQRAEGLNSHLGGRLFFREDLQKVIHRATGEGFDPFDRVLRIRVPK